MWGNEETNATRAHQRNSQKGLGIVRILGFEFCASMKVERGFN